MCHTPELRIQQRSLCQPNPSRDAAFEKKSFLNLSLNASSEKTKQNVYFVKLENFYFLRSILKTFELPNTTALNFTMGLKCIV